MSFYEALSILANDPRIGVLIVLDAAVALLACRLFEKALDRRFYP